MQRLGWGVVSTAVGVYLGTMGWAADARASGFATQKFGGEFGNPVTTNPTALYYNPAGIGFSEGMQLYLDEEVAFRHVTWTHQPGHDDPTTGPASTGNSGEAKLFNVFAGPTLGFSAKLGDHFAFGVGAFVPFAGREHWSKNDAPLDPKYPLAADGPQRWASIEGALTFLYATAGAALKFGPVSFGVSGNFVYSWVQFTKAEQITSSPIPNTVDEARAKLDVSGADASVGAGVMVEAWPKHLWLGASYQSAPGVYNPNKEQRLSGKFNVFVPNNPSIAFNKDVDLLQGLPDVFRAGIRFRPVPSVELRAFGDYTRWGNLTHQCIVFKGQPCVVYSNGAAPDPSTSPIVLNLVRGWNNTFGYRGGLSWYASPDVELFLGGGYDQAAIPDQTLDTIVSDANNYQGTLGGRFQVAGGFFLGVSWTQIMYQNRDTTGKSYTSYYQGVSQMPDSGGLYTQWIGILDFMLEKHF